MVWVDGSGALRHDLSRSSRRRFRLRRTAILKSLAWTSELKQYLWTGPKVPGTASAANETVVHQWCDALPQGSPAGASSATPSPPSSEPPPTRGVLQQCTVLTPATPEGGFRAASQGLALPRGDPPLGSHELQLAKWLVSPGAPSPPDFDAVDDKDSGGKLAAACVHSSVGRPTIRPPGPWGSPCAWNLGPAAPSRSSTFPSPRGGPDGSSFATFYGDFGEWGLGAPHGEAARIQLR